MSAFSTDAAVYTAGIGREPMIVTPSLVVMWKFESKAVWTGFTRVSGEDKKSRDSR